MIRWLIDWSLRNRVTVLIGAALIALCALQLLPGTAVDALPDLSDTQVIVRTSYPGQAPQIVEDQVTYPLTTALMSTPGVSTVRGYSMLGESFIYVLFRDGTDPYWVRSRVLEALRQSDSLLPSAAQSQIGPDATGASWIYEYALRDADGTHDLSSLRALQDWTLKFELQAVEGVAEVASVGGTVRTFQVIVDPARLSALRIGIEQVHAAIRAGNAEAGGSVIEQAQAQYMVRAGGYVKGVEDLRRIPVASGKDGAPVLLQDVAQVRVGAELRRSIADLDGTEVAGGIIVMRHGANPQRTIAAVKARLVQLRTQLPPGVEIVTTYDRSTLIGAAVDSLTSKLLQEFAVVVLVCLLFLGDWRSGAVIVIALPLAVGLALLVMRLQGLTANIMSLGGIAIAVGAMVDAAIVMTENFHRRWSVETADGRDRLAAVREACSEVGPALVVSLVIVALSFVPVLALQGQSGRLFAPLAFTKTYAMLAAAVLSATLVPVLILLLVRPSGTNRISGAVNRRCAGLYAPLLEVALRSPWLVTTIALLAVLCTLWPATRLGIEFMPAMHEGDLLYMPSTLPGISTQAARSLLQQTDRLLLQVPEVEAVFGKAGRAETATDPAPLEMIETLVRLKPRDQWRHGLTLEQLRKQLDEQVKLPGVANLWLPPIKARVDMSSTGMRSMLGIKIAGADLRELQKVGSAMESLLKTIPGAASVYAERGLQGRYVQIDPDRVAAAGYGLNIEDIQNVVRYAIGGESVGQVVDTRERYPITLRYPLEWRDSAEGLRALPISRAGGAQIVLADVAQVRVADGPALIRSENARPAAWIYLELRDRDLESFVREASAMIAAANIVPPGYTWQWSGQYEYLQRALASLKSIVPITIALIVLLLYLNFRRADDVLIVLGALPVALVGGVWLMWALDYHLSVATMVGFIALGGLAAETGIVMMLYLNQAWASKCAQVSSPTLVDLRAAIVDGALLRLRPKLMTVLTILAGLLPVMFGSGAGSEVMKRIAAPMVGGMIGATLLTLVVIPALYWLRHSRVLSRVAER